MARTQRKAVTKKAAGTKAKKPAKTKGIKHVVIDVDGVLTDGAFYYSERGKELKRFGPDDSDALSLLKRHVDVIVISGDKRGFPITERRVKHDMGLTLFPVSTFDRISWIREHYDPMETVYIGDGIFDAPVFREVAYGIAPANAFFRTRQEADYVTQARGGEGAVAEACVHIVAKFFGKDLLEHTYLKKGEGVWGK